MSWLPILVSGWLVCAVAAALLIGRAIGLADRRERERLDAALDRIPRPRGARLHVAGMPHGSDSSPRTGHTSPPEP